MLENWKVVVDSSDTVLQRAVLQVFLVFSLSEGDGSGIPVKRSLAEALGKKVEVDKAPTNATGMQRALQIDAQIFDLGFVFLLTSTRTDNTWTFFLSHLIPLIYPHFHKNALEMI